MYSNHLIGGDMENINENYVYIMISKTNTVLGTMIQKSLGVSYNHCSITLDESLETIYSVGRKEMHNVFIAGFVTESKSRGFFAIHNDADIVLLRLPVYIQKEEFMEIILEYQQTPFKYNLLGLLYCYCGIPIIRENKLFCSQFVDQVLKKSGIECFNKPSELIRPHDFLEIPFAEVVYEGKIRDYQVLGGMI